MELKFYNTLTRSLETFKSVEEGKAGLYTCGPTVYNFAHIGNFRAYIFEDLLHRTLEYAGYKVKQVMNLTDVDDKTIRNSQAQGMPLGEYTAKWTAKFHDDCKALNCLAPHVEPSAVGHIKEQLDIVQKLMDGGHAYQSDDGSVYFRISSYAEYGKLAHLDRQELDLGKTAQTRADTDEYEKDSVADFVLWKARRPEDGVRVAVRVAVRVVRKSEPQPVPPFVRRTAPLPERFRRRAVDRQAASRSGCWV